MSLVSFVLVVADQLLFTEQPVGGEVGPLRSRGAEPQAVPERRSAMRGSRPRGCGGASQARWATGVPATGVRAGLRCPARCSHPCAGPGRAPPHLRLPRRRPHTARLLRSCPRGLLSLPLVHAVSKWWATGGGVALCPVASPSFKRLPLGAPVSRAVAGTAGWVPGAAPPARSVPRAAHFSRLRLLTWEAVVLCDLNPTHLTGRRRPVPPAPGLASCPGRRASAPLHLAFRWTSGRDP